MSRMLMPVVVLLAGFAGALALAGCSPYSVKINPNRIPPRPADSEMQALTRSWCERSLENPRFGKFLPARPAFSYMDYRLQDVGWRWGVMINTRSSKGVFGGEELFEFFLASTGELIVWKANEIGEARPWLFIHDVRQEQITGTPDQG